MILGNLTKQETTYVFLSINININLEVQVEERLAENNIYPLQIFYC